MKSFLSLAFFLICAVPVCAQRGSGGSGPGGGGHFGSGGSLHAGGVANPYYAGGGSDGFGSEIGPSDATAWLRYDPPTDFGIVSAGNDGPFVPSTFMNYDDALALGKQQLAASQEESKGKAPITLGEFARWYRANRVPTLQLRSRIVQDAAGKLEICNLNGNDCRLI
jgi:hypothetical protein